MASQTRITILCAAAIFAAASLSAAEQPKDAPASSATAPAAPSPTPTPAAKSTFVHPSLAAKPAASGPGVSQTADQTVKLPVFPVSAARLREIDIRIKKLEKLITREKQALERSALDDTINNEQTSKAAAIFGGKSTAQRDSVTLVRIESMEKEVDLLDKLRTPLTKSDRELIEKLIEDQLVYRRSLDEALR